MLFDRSIGRDFAWNAVWALFVAIVLYAYTGQLAALGRERGSHVGRNGQIGLGVRAVLWLTVLFVSLPTSMIAIAAIYAPQEAFEGADITLSEFWSIIFWFYAWLMSGLVFFYLLACAPRPPEYEHLLVPRDAH